MLMAWYDQHSYDKTVVTHLPISKIWFLKCDIKFSNVILGSENINFNGLQIFDA